MNTISLKTESFLVQNKLERFFPFFELEFNEWVIYENDIPKYFFVLNNACDFKIITFIEKEIKNKNDLENIIINLGKKYFKNWSIFPAQKNHYIQNTQKTEDIILEILNDQVIFKLIAGK
ncbi:MAG: hypothetical protein ACPGTS_00125 [Minisyncoccia bacterium]